MISHDVAALFAFELLEPLDRLAELLAAEDERRARSIHQPITWALSTFGVLKSYQLGTTLIVPCKALHLFH